MVGMKVSLCYMIMDYGFWILDSIDPRRVSFLWKIRREIRWDRIWRTK
jgi:hypothetical protein